MLAHVPSFGRNPMGSPDFLAYPVPKACMHVPGTRVPRCLGVARSASSPKAAQALGCMKVLPWVVEGAGGLGAGKTSGAGTRGVSLDVVIGGRTGYSNTNGGESSDNRSKVHADCGPAENPSL